MWRPSATAFTRNCDEPRRICRRRNLGFFCILAVITMSMTAKGDENQAGHYRRRRHSHQSSHSPGAPEGRGDWRLGPGANSREPVYVGYGGDPWGPSSGTDLSTIPHPRPLSSLQFNSTSSETRTKGLLSIHRAGSSHARSKRGVVHLYNMVVCATGCNPLAYKGYGCYCGFLGSGFTIDGIDQCCKMHDLCYESADCPMFLEYFIPYYWKCYHGYKPICAIEHGEWGGSGSCAQRLCECDRALSECLRRYPCPTTKAVCTSSPWRLIQNLFMTF